MPESELRGDVGELIDRAGRLARTLQYVDGLNPAQWEALRYLARANRYSRNPSALADFLGVTKGTVSQTLIALEGKVFLRRVRGISDRRAVRLELTPAGEALLAHDPLLRIDEAVARLSPGARASLVEGLDQLVRDFPRRGGGGGFGVCETCCQFCADAAGDERGGPHRCGMTGEPLSDDEKRRICVKFRSDA